MAQTYRGFTKAELEFEYGPSQNSHRIKEGDFTADDVIMSHVTILGEGSVKIRESFPAECKQMNLKHTANGTEEATVDLFLPKNAPDTCPIVTYVHGGYWAFLDKKSSAWFAGTFLDQGIGVAVVGYDLCPKVTMDELVAQVRNGVALVAQTRPNADLFLCGHSAGGHLVAMMMATDWTKHGIDRTFIKGATLVSGVFDLEPILLSSVNDPLHMDEAEAKRNSPQLLLGQIPTDVPIVVAMGEHDSKEFIRQSEEFHLALVERGCPAELLMLPGEDHFTAIERLMEPGYSLSQAVLAQIQKKA